MKTKLLLFLALHFGLTTGVAQPIITSQPQNQTNLVGTTATFVVGATGTEPLSYQWRSYLSASSSSYTNIPIGMEAMLVVTNVQPTSRVFAIVVTDAGGLSVTSSPPVALIVLTPPRISSQPKDNVVDTGTTARLVVAASGTASLAYQWQFNDHPIGGNSSSLLTLVNVQYTNAGRYRVVVTNVFGVVTSQVAVLTVGPALHGFSKIAALASGAISLSLTGVAPARFKSNYDLYPIEVSTNLRDWSPLATLVHTNAAAMGRLTWTLTPPTTTSAFTGRPPIISSRLPQNRKDPTPWARALGC